MHAAAAADGIRGGSAEADCDFAGRERGVNSCFKVGCALVIQVLSGGAHAQTIFPVECLFAAGAKISVERDTFGQTKPVSSHHFRFASRTTTTGVYTNLQRGWTGNILLRIEKKRIEISEDIDSDNGFVVTIFLRRDASRGLPAVFSQHAFEAGLQDYYSPEIQVGFCK